MLEYMHECGHGHLAGEGWVRRHRELPEWPFGWGLTGWARTRRAGSGRHLEAARSPARRALLALAGRWRGSSRSSGRLFTAPARSACRAGCRLPSSG